jgi:phage virion morphogenesis protein
MEVNDKKIQALLTKLKAKMSDLTPVMQEAGEILHDSIMENFEQEGRPKWKELSPVTLAIRRKYGWTGKILNIHGASGLVGSINYRAGKNSVRIGTAKKYARDLHFGAAARNLPARPFIDYKPDDLTEIKAAINRYLIKEM